MSNTYDKSFNTLVNTILYLNIERTRSIEIPNGYNFVQDFIYIYTYLFIASKKWACAKPNAIVFI